MCDPAGEACLAAAEINGPNLNCFLLKDQQSMRKEPSKKMKIIEQKFFKSLPIIINGEGLHYFKNKLYYYP